MTPLLFLLAFGISVESARILAFFPVPFPSHHFIFRPVIEGLAQKGHQILYVTGFPYKESPNNIDQIIIRYNVSELRGDNAWVNEMSGLPDNPSYQLDFKSGLSNDMSFWQRLYNTYVTGVTTIAGYYYLHFLMQPIMDKYFNYTGWESRPSIDVLARNRSLILVNFDYLFGYPYPVAPHRKDIGGINIKPNEVLPKDLQTFMDESKEGVIFMSLGSHIDAKYLKEQMNAFLEVFKELPQRVLMKYEPEDESQVPPNVKLSKWFPQQDILAHKNCILFITHGGLLSLAEATYHGLPLVGIPILADQAKNLAFVESQGFGRMLGLNNVTKETVSWTVQEVLSNSRYREEALRRSKIFKDRRQTPAEEAVYWVEHSLKYPFALTPESTKFSAVVLHMLYIKLFITLVFFLAIYILYSVIKVVKTLTCKTKRKK
ncbi:unnamed protein product [Nezara viridula]|uniref:UDP-glucuronosyltransferase n=1 Tax=Nezara viridula TaxID=85310 RepID=A0A9P0E454_NEZVI|nr:unnamed protein product [Nezara viridula]